MAYFTMAIAIPGKERVYAKSSLVLQLSTRDSLVPILISRGHNMHPLHVNI